MNRIDEIKHAANRLAATKNNETAYNQCLYDFELAVEWADENPSEATVLRIVRLYKQWYTTESGMSIVDYIKEHWNDEQ